MVVVVFLLFCGLHNEAGDSKFRKGRQYIAYVGHIGAFLISFSTNGDDQKILRDNAPSVCNTTFKILSKMCFA